MSRAVYAELDLRSNKIVSLADPTQAQDAATKAYVDATRQGLDVKASVRAATAAPVTLSGAQTVDGVALVAGDRVLVKDQASGAQNGIYVVAAGAWARATDFDSDADVTAGAFVFVAEGTANADSGWVLTTNDPIVLGTTALQWTQFSGAGQIIAGAGLTKTGNTLDVGAGSGILVNPDEVAIDTAVVVRKAAFTIGDGAASIFALAHGLGTRDVAVVVYQNATPYAEIIAEVEHTDANNVTVRFPSPPTLNEFRAVVHA